MESVHRHFVNQEDFMTAVAPRVDDYVAPTRPEPTGNAKTGSKAWVFLTTTDHKQLGIMYLLSLIHI